jgi:3-dehydroquinate synthase
VTTLVMETSRGVVPYHVGAGMLDRIGDVAEAVATAGRRFVVTDANVGPLHAAGVAARLDAPLLAVPAGEERKSLQEAERVARWLLRNGIERRDVVVAVGGGVVTDLAGFAASITLRGVAWIAVPTTLLGMVDAAVGGKTGVDLDVGKNLLGTFWQPGAVVADPRALATLDRRQLRSGLAEVVKAAMISPAPLAGLLDAHLARLVEGDLAGVEDLVLEAVRVKAEIVAADEREAGRRAALNLGHTLGHALEAATRYGRFLHGEAVTWGLLAVLSISAGRGLMERDAARAWARRLQALAPLPPLADLPWDALAAFIGRDKKATAGTVGWVLPRDAGVNLASPVSPDEAAAAFRRLGALSPAGPFTPLLDAAPPAA